MIRSLLPASCRQTKPLPGLGDRRIRRRITIFVIVITLGTALLWAGHDLQTTLLTLLGLGLAAATIAKWVIDDAPLPSVLSFQQGLGQ